MFRRPESLRERTLLRLVESLQRTITDQNRVIADQNNRLMYLTGNAWQVPAVEPRPEAEPVVRTWTASPEQEPIH